MRRWLGLCTVLAVALGAGAGCGDDDVGASDDSGLVDGGPGDAGRDGSPLDAAFDAAFDSGPDGEASDDAGPRVDAGSPPPPPVELGRHRVEVVTTTRVVPSDGLGVEVDASNNNLDVIDFEGRVYLAWRTAPDHFAGTETRIEVASSEDEVTWRHETTVSVGTDLREPRFLEVGGTLFLFIAQLGTSRTDFEPQGVGRIERTAEGAWTEWQRLPEFDGYIAWRTRVVDDTPYMVAYLGGGSIYDLGAEPIRVDLLTTADGRAWAPVNDARRSIHVGGGSETDFALKEDGSLLGVIRNEAGTDGAFGSLVCQAPAADITDWSCRTDPRKYDSPLVFRYDGETYLIGRRNVTSDGAFDLMDEDLEFPVNAISYQLEYLDAPKRCALWRFIEEEGSVRIGFVLDLPSRGDTCFASVIEGSAPNERVVYDYSSDIEGPDLSWSRGQIGGTFVYRHLLRFSEN